MKYFISNKETKFDKNNKPYICATLTDEQGTVYDKINAFRGEFNGTEVEGSLVQNGKFWNFEAKTTYTANIPARGAGIQAAMQTKANNIEEAQDRKNDAIALAGSITNATNLVKSMMEAGILSPIEQSDIKTTIRNYIIWYQQLYKNPTEINPSSSDVPF